MDGDNKYDFSDAQLKKLENIFQPGLFNNKVLLVSGAGSGIGKTTAYLLARLGATLVICGRDQKKIDHAAEQLQSLGAEVMAKSVDIRDPDQSTQLMTDIWNRFGRLDALVNNAGGQFAKAAIDISPNGWRAVVDNNLNGTWFMMQAAARQWRDHQQQGNIINIVVVIDRGLCHLTHTVAARAGIIYASKTAAVEWAPYNIRINCIAPGVIESNGFNTYPESVVKTFKRSNPMLRTGNSHDIAQAVVYLASPASGFITGETIKVDGGGALWGEYWGAGERPEYFDE